MLIIALLLFLYYMHVSCVFLVIKYCICVLLPRIFICAADLYQVNRLQALNAQICVQSLLVPHCNLLLLWIFVSRVAFFCDSGIPVSGIALLMEATCHRQ